MWLIFVFLTLFFGALAAAYAWFVYQEIEKVEIENPRVAELSDIIHKGAMAFLKKE